jgi:hypothetical protein
VATGSETAPQNQDEQEMLMDDTQDEDYTDVFEGFD